MFLTLSCLKFQRKAGICALIWWPMRPVVSHQVSGSAGPDLGRNTQQRGRRLSTGQKGELTVQGTVRKKSTPNSGWRGPAPQAPSLPRLTPVPFLGFLSHSSARLGFSLEVPGQMLPGAILAGEKVYAPRAGSLLALTCCPPGLWWGGSAGTC